MYKYLIIFIFSSQILFSQEISYMKEWVILINDLANSNTNGYKSHMLEIDYYNLTNDDLLNNLHIPRGIEKTNFSQGPIHYTNRELDFAILGEGFFKILLEDGTIAYTRNGEFMIDTNESVIVNGKFSKKEVTNELIMVNGKYRLYDPIYIIPGYTQILFTADHLIIAVYPNGDEINVGRLNIYNLETNELRDINNNWENGYIFLYSGNEEYLYNGRVEHKCIELSNVSQIGTILRLIQISRILGMELIFENE